MAKVRVMHAIDKPNYKTRYKCHDCGATSYLPVLVRSVSGALMPSGQYRCSGCRGIFATVKAWCRPRRMPEFEVSRHFG